MSAFRTNERRRRFAFGFVAAMSLAIGAATAWLCIESANLDDYLIWAKWYEAKPDTIARYVGVDGHDWRVAVFYGSIDLKDPQELPMLRGTMPPGGTRIRIPKGEDAENVYWRPSSAWWGFSRAERNFPIARLSQVGVVAPGLFVMGVTLIPSAICAVRLVRNRLRRSRGLCAACGYDLRGSASVCPECGTKGICKGDIQQ